MTPPGYSLEQEVTDGPITAPRWLHHLVVKLCAQHSAPTFALWALTGRPLLAALIGGPSVWMLITIRERIWPTDPEPLTTWQHVADWMTDLSIATVPVAIAFVALGAWLAAALILAACIAGYLAGHRNARP
jgi:hypothetical protein